MLRFQRSRGFSIAEAMVALTIFLLIGGGLLNLGWRKGEARSSGVAEMLEEEFRAARLEAMKDKTYVALVFPSEGGTKPHASAYYRLEGTLKPRLTRSIDLSTEYPGLSIFVGFWDLDSTTLNDAAASNTAALAKTQTDWDFSAWEAPFPLDHHLVFGPDGRVYSSNLPRFDNAYHFLVTEAVEYSSATLDGVRTFSPKKVLAPTTVTVSLAGYVGTTQGVLSQDGAVEIMNGSVDSSTKPAKGPSVPGRSTNDPSIGPVSIFPLPEPQTLPPGVDATVDLNGYLTLQITAEDKDGDRLFCNWTAEKVSGSGSASGVFSAPQQNQMEWEDDRWVATWEWRPPTDALPGDIYQLDVSVTDETGRTVQGQLGASGRVEIIGAGQIVYQRGGDVWIVNADGTGERNVTNHPANDYDPAISPDGTRISFVSDRDGAENFYVMGVDGQNVRKVAHNLPGKAPRGVTWSPRGNELALGINENEPTSADYAKEALFIATTDGSNIRQISNWADVNACTWHPTLNYVVVTGESGKELREYDLDNGSVIDLTDTANQWEYNPRFSPDGSKLTFSRGPNPVSNGGYPDQNTDDFDIFIADYAPGSISNLRKVGDSGSVDLHPAWSPEGNRLVFCSDRSGRFELYVMDENGNNLRQLTTGGGRRPHWGRF